MAIESASFISDLNTSNPPGSDPVGQADDHIRLLKSVLKTTFPNITGPVSSTQAQLNGALVPTGAILLWSGATNAVPSGWVLCNGQTVARSDGTGNITAPDLQNRFVVCAGTTYPVGNTGGAASVTPTITLTNQAVSLTEAQLPAHTHANTLNETAHTHTATQAPHNHTDNTVSGNSGAYSAGGFGAIGSLNTITGSTQFATPVITVNTATTGITITNASVGSGSSHIHNNTAASSAVATVPPYYALAYIMKT